MRAALPMSGRFTLAFAVIVLPICTTIASDDPAITIFFTVHDKRGQAVSGLKSTDIILNEDGQPQQIELLAEAAAPARSVALLIDRSGTRRGQLPRSEERPAAHFFSSLLRTQDRGMVVSFAREAELLCDLTGEMAQLERAIARAVATYAGGSAVYDAIFAVIDKRLYGTAGVKYVVVVTDGLDNSSRVAIGDVIGVAHRNNVSIHVLLLPGYRDGSGRSNPRGRDKRMAERLTTETGGSLFELNREEDFEQAFLTLAAELRNAYVARYIHQQFETRRWFSPD